MCLHWWRIVEKLSAHIVDMQSYSGVEWFDEAFGERRSHGRLSGPFELTWTLFRLWISDSRHNKTPLKSPLMHKQQCCTCTCCPHTITNGCLFLSIVCDLQFAASVHQSKLQNMIPLSLLNAINALMWSFYAHISVKVLIYAHTFINP